MERLTQPIAGNGNTVLLFGPQALSFDQEEFRRIRSAILLDSKENQWIVHTIHEFTEWLDIIARSNPWLQVGKAFRLPDVSGRLTAKSQP